MCYRELFYDDDKQSAVRRHSAGSSSVGVAPVRERSRREQTQGADGPCPEEVAKSHGRAADVYSHFGEIRDTGTCRAKESKVSLTSSNWG